MKLIRLFALALYGAASSLWAQSHPSGVSQRVLIAVQNPTGSNSGSNQIVPQFSMQIADAANNTFSTSSPPLISGWSTSIPASIQNLTAEGYGLVQNEDGSAALVHLA